MSSINLLPKNLKDNLKDDRGNNIIFAASLIIIVLPFIFYAYIYINVQMELKKGIEISREILKVDENLEKEFFDNKLLVAEKKVDNASAILANHRYFTKIFKIVQDSLIKEVYLEDLSVGLDEKTGIVLNFHSIAKDNLSVASQIDVFRKNEFINNISVDNISVSQDGNVEFDVSLVFKKEKILY